MSSFFSPLAHPVFRWLFFGQVVSLLGTGMATVALALMVYDLSPLQAGLVLGSALAVKMVAYLCVAPVVGGYSHAFPRRSWLAGLNLGRAVIVFLLPLATDVWQIFILIFLLNALAAGYTPVYQALLPDVLPDEDEYTRALSLSRLAMELESLLSPALAAGLLLITSYELLFRLNSIAFVLAAGCIFLVQVPKAAANERTGGVWQHVSFGIISYFKTPRLRGVLALNLALSAAGAMIIVNTVVYVRQVLGMSESAVPTLMAAAGVGSMALAFVLPKLLDHFSNRTVMLAGGVLFSAALFLGLTDPGYIGLFPIWFLIGGATSMVLIPTGRVVRDSCNAGDRNDYFSANFALTHGMWLVGYLLAGSIGSEWGMQVCFAILGVVALLATMLAAKLWQHDDQENMWHVHPAQEHLHPHTHDEHHQHTHEGWEGPEPHVHPHYHAKHRHRHRFVIDEHHAHWPKQ
ncbi:MFS transporter [Aliamphritea ceti]|uniref:MFS transporter n=1 Tax=Aliamphritea ceti TaxID=1524258 RepID=UPI0021C37181|nr:MFS transporter [Aliamphritea ceti]